MKSKEMIYLKNIFTSRAVLIPKSRKTEGELVFTIKNTINQTVLEQNVTDIWSLGLYFKFDIDLPADITPGEYEYFLSDDAGILSTGLLIMGEPSTSTEYNKTIQYEQY